MHKFTYILLLPIFILFGCSSELKLNPINNPPIGVSLDEIGNNFRYRNPPIKRNWRDNDLIFNAIIVQFRNDIISNGIHLTLMEPNSKYKCAALITFTDPEAKMVLMDDFYEGDLISVSGKIADYSVFDRDTNCGIRIINPAVIKIGRQ